MDTLQTAENKEEGASHLLASSTEMARRCAANRETCAVVRASNSQVARFF